ncbi:hypothetical protein V6N11_069500 [Hibiscus sabdariffa]|uniref:Syntaxin-5 N-terminal Sly1p-binding domain-containing protein n=1 Tax=Hibiscus sabdariffa TaxID=183260 RepID=A0ABR2Q2X9_9ROSI
MVGFFSGLTFRSISLCSSDILDVYSDGLTLLISTSFDLLFVGGIVAFLLNNKMPVNVAQSSFRDRTQEFQSVAERLRKSFSSGADQNGPSSSSSRATEQRSVVAHQSEFNRKASKIGFGIHQTSQKLSKLAKCASSRD